MIEKKKIVRNYNNFEDIASDMSCAMESDDEELMGLKNVKITLIIEGDYEED